MEKWLAEKGLNKKRSASSWPVPADVGRPDHSAKAMENGLTDFKKLLSLAPETGVILLH